MDQGIRSVENGQEGLVAMHKPLLHLELRDGPQEAQPRELLKLQHGQSVVLRHVPDARLGEDGLGKETGTAVKGIGNDPIEHLNQEGESLQDPAVDVAGKAGGVRGVYCGATDPPLLRRVLHGRHVIAQVVIEGIIPGQVVGRSRGVRLSAQKAILPRRVIQYPIALPPGDDHGPDQDARNHLGFW